MAFQHDQIGRFQFVRLSPLPQNPRPELEIAARAGVDGVQLWDTGSRGTPEQVQSLAAVPNLAVAHALARAYRTLRGDRAQRVRYAQKQLESLYFVVDVQATVRRLIRGHLGGDNRTYGAQVEAVWTLLPIDP